MIQVVDLYKRFGEKEVLKGISATFEKGKTNLIIGQSGSGKTVLLKTILGLFEPTSGEINFGDRSLSTMSSKEKKLFRSEMGMVFQGGALFDSLTVEENVMFPIGMFGKMSREEALDRANFCLQRVNLPNAHKLFPAEISGGMQKRVAIARAIATNPKYLFCDEPNSGLDPETAIVIDNLIKEITEEFEITTLVNTHDMNSVLEIGENVVFIKFGEKIWQGTKEEILQADNEDVLNYVFKSNLFKRVRNALTK